MNRSHYSLIVEASLLDVEELRNTISEEDLQIVRPPIDSDIHNELATVIIITLTQAALAAITFWLLRTHREELIEYNVTTRQPDGTETMVQLKIRRFSSEAPKDQVIKQVADALKIPKSSILKVS